MKPRINPLPIDKLGLGLPYITTDELNAVSRVIKSGWLSLGQETEKFEKAIADYIGAKYAIAANSGTAALHSAVIISGIKAGDEVITTPFTFVASTNCLLYEKARPVFVDIDENNFNIDVNLIESKITKKTKAILAVDIFGYPAEWEKILSLAKKYNLKVIEDAAEAIGAKYKGKKLGSHGHLTIFGFFPNKQMTTGDGGVVVTNKKKEYLLIKKLINQGHSSNQPQSQYDSIGYNYRITEMSAALGQKQLEKLDQFLTNRRQVAKWYDEQLINVSGITLLKSDDKYHQRSWFVYVVRIDKNINREKLVAKLTAERVPVKTYFSSMHLQPYLRQLGYKLGDFPISETVSRSTLTLPFYTGMTQKTVKLVCNKLKKYL